MPFMLNQILEERQHVLFIKNNLLSLESPPRLWPNRFLVLFYYDEMLPFFFTYANLLA